MDALERRLIQAFPGQLRHRLTQSRPSAPRIWPHLHLARELLMSGAPRRLSNDDLERRAPR